MTSIFYIRTVTACAHCRVNAPRSRITGACDPYMHAPGGSPPFRLGKTRRKRQAREARRK